MKRAAVDDPGRIGEARDSLLRDATEQIAKQIADQLDRVIFMALCVQFGGPYFAWEDLRGRCQRVCSPNSPDRYLLDGRPILEVDRVPALEPFDVLGRREISAGFKYRILPRPE